MSASQEPTEGSSADHSRSGADVAEAIGVAESGSSVREVHDSPEDTTSGAAPVEQAQGDPEMTEGRPGGGDGDARNPNPAEAGSGGAQSVVGARTSDRVASGEAPPSGAPFDR